jgi:sugar phosphate isomerase/epimerase
MQMDTGNCMDGGGDPVHYLKKFTGRARTVHLKEYSAKNPNAIVGEGDVAWQDVISACQTVGKTEWFIIEQETGSYSPLETAERSLKNLKQLLAGKKAVGKK